ncbi:CHRD domain-containing protein [Chachezhania sediminis]|uniref:CHRD domain-containing protein n=1 Tax=Chachezhania sediminis TaxID=2599291 RepID=UPI00131B3F3D|nr:CHRD domain-containing protein [Chachezhania sediminis]
MKSHQSVLRVLAIPALSVFAPHLLAAEIVHANSHLSSDHEIAAHWGSSLAASGQAMIEIEPATGILRYLRVDVDGLAPDELAHAGPNGALGPIHFHNYPQGGPQFFVQQLPGTISATERGLRLEVTDWKMDAPMVGQERGLTAAFVIQEILDGNAYIGLHTTHTACPQNRATGLENSCAAPGTAISGHIQVLTQADQETLPKQ